VIVLIALQQIITLIQGSKYRIFKYF